MRRSQNLKLSGFKTYFDLKVWEQNMCGFSIYYFNFERNYDVLKSKSPCIFLRKNVNFNKNETKSKMENPTNRFRETNLVLQLIWKSQIKSKTMMGWSLRNQKERAFFVPLILSERKLFKICVACQCIVYWIYF